MKKIIPFVLICLLAGACTKNDTSTSRTELNVGYGADARQKMDIYLPANRSASDTKVIILIHGGGWSAGDKSDFTAVVPVLQQRLPGYAVFNLNYRLASPGVNLFPTQEMDVKAAVEFIYSQRSRYGISDKFVLLGASAGGHLALLQSYKYDSPVRPKAVVSFFGPTDMTALYNSSPTASAIAQLVAGATPSSNPVVYQQSSPVTFVSAQSPPTLLLHGGRDQLVPPAQATTLQGLLNSAGVPNQYVLYPDEDHGWGGANLTDSYNKIVQFLTTHVN